MLHGRVVFSAVREVSADAALECLHDGIAGVGYVRDAVPRHGQKLDDTEYQHQSFLVKLQKHNWLHS